MTFIRSHKKQLSLLAAAMLTISASSPAFAGWFSDFRSSLTNDMSTAWQTITVDNAKKATRAITFKNIKFAVLSFSNWLEKDTKNQLIALGAMGVIIGASIHWDPIRINQEALRNHKKMAHLANISREEAYHKNAQLDRAKQDNRDMMRHEARKQFKDTVMKNTVIETENREQIALSAIDVTVEDANAQNAKKDATELFHQKDKELQKLRQEIANTTDASEKKKLAAAEDVLTQKIFETMKAIRALKNA